MDLYEEYYTAPIGPLTYVQHYRARPVPVVVERVRKQKRTQYNRRYLRKVGVETLQERNRRYYQQHRERVLEKRREARASMRDALSIEPV